MAMKREDAVPVCIQAGCDIFLFNISLQSDFEYMLRGIERGLLSLERLDEAVTRILALKASLKLHIKKAQNSLVPAEGSLTVLRDAQHQHWARQCADQAITLVKDKQGLLPLSPERHRKIRLYVLGDSDDSVSHTGAGSTGKTFKSLLESRGFEIELFSMACFDTSILQKPPVEQVGPYDLIIYYANLGAVSNQTVIRVNWIAPFGTITPKYIQEKPTMFISVASPYHLQDVPRIKTMINAYTASDMVVESLVEKLLGNSEFSGRSPVDPFCGFWDARL
jgi:beta-N-acetylhexosaminidase